MNAVFGVGQGVTVHVCICPLRLGLLYYRFILPAVFPIWVHSFGAHFRICNARYHNWPNRPNPAPRHILSASTKQIAKSNSNTTICFLTWTHFLCKHINNPTGRYNFLHDLLANYFYLIHMVGILIIIGQLWYRWKVIHFQGWRDPFTVCFDIKSWNVQ